MARETLVPLDLAGAGQLEPLGSTLVRLHLWHRFLQIIIFLSLTDIPILILNKSGYYTPKGFILSLRNCYDFGATTMVM